jgi:bifunctional non-homologous end joining protein LigD
MRKRHYRPMLAADAERPFSSDDWLFEVKWDGVRAIAYVDEEISIRSRNGNELLGALPELHELADIAPRTVLDGEIVLMRGGRPDIQALMGRIQRSPGVPMPAGEPQVTYLVFDILEQDGEPLVSLPLSERKRRLSAAMREGKAAILATYVEGRGEEYYAAAVRMGLEGVVAKRKDSPYEPGVRSGNWRKIKQLRTCDCAIFGFTHGKGWRSGGLGALVLGLCDGRTPVYIGRVGTGFSDAEIRDIPGLLTPLDTGRKVFAGESPDVTWVRPVLVAEVAYQTLTRERRLRMPRFIRFRPDKDPSECTIDQLGTDPLIGYHEKRDFVMTPEPKGKGEGGPVVRPGFVVHEHHARRLHYDFRLERDGVLKSWAVPKGIPEDPGEKRLAIETEDHPLEYISFEGTIPEGEYGAGTVSIWDRGSYEPLRWDDREIEVMLSGSRLKGRYVLVRFRRAGMDQWLIFRARES